MKTTWKALSKVLQTVLHIISVLMLSGAGAIATLVLIEYSVGKPAKSAWTGIVPMASPTAICLWLVSAAVLILFFTKRI